MALTLSTLTKKHQVFIRPLELSDYENWVQAHTCLNPPQNEWDMTNWKDSELTRSQFKKILQRQKNQADDDHFFEYGVFQKNDGVLVGQVSLMDISRGIFQNAYLGYRIFNPYWGRGYATQACLQLMALAFKQKKLHRLEAGISAKNKASIRVAEKIGFKKEGLSRKRLFVDNKWQDLLIYAVTCEDSKIKYQFPKK